MPPTDSSWRDLGIAGVALGWITVMLVTDPWSGIGGQRALGVVTWAVLLWLLRAETSLVCTQVAVVVAFATVVEYTFSLWFQVYVYRLANIPVFVPPAHGLVYLCALALGRSPVVHRWRVPLLALTLAAGASYALWGLLGTHRVDVARGVLVLLPGGVPDAEAVAVALRGLVRDRHLPGAARHRARRLGVATA